MEEHGERIGDKWIEARTLYHAMTADKTLPPGSKDERDKPPEPNWTEMREAKEWRMEHDAEFRHALESPKHFGAFLGLGHILGEPPAREVKTAQDLEAERRSFLAQSLQAWG